MIYFYQKHYFEIKWYFLYQIAGCSKADGKWAKEHSQNIQKFYFCVQLITTLYKVFYM